MAVRLKRLLTKNRQAVAGLLTEASTAMRAEICVQDASGEVLLGKMTTPWLERHAIESGGETIGWVAGGNGSQALAHWLTHLANQAAEIEALSDEALNRYREVNLLYSLSGKLTASLDPEAVCCTALEETRRLIHSTHAGVMLLDETGEKLDLAASFGPLPDQVILGEGVIGACAQAGKAEVVNAVETDPRHSLAESAYSALLCTPLETRRQLLGVIVLASEAGDVYSAGDLKLLTTLASQSAPIIENALTHAKMLQEAKEREAWLEQQIQALRIELDESRQAQKVAEITETDYFKSLMQQADDLRKIVKDIP